MPKAGSIKRITNPDNKYDFFDVRVIDELQIKHGSRRIFQRRKIKFLNNEKNSRKVEAKTITHKAVDKEGNPPPEDLGDVDDASQKVVVEEIKSFITKHGRGGIYQKNTTKLDHNKEKNGRKTHRVRLRKGTGWLDIERTDQFSLVHGRGGKFRREIIKVKWDDAGFDATEGIPIHQGPKDGFDPPWRLDPLQNIKNVKWSDPVQVGFSMTWTWEFSQETDNEPGTVGCDPVEVDRDPPDDVVESMSGSYAFSLSAGSPQFTPSSPLITESNTTQSGEPLAPLDGSSANSSGFQFNPDASEAWWVQVDGGAGLGASATIPMRKNTIAGAEKHCYGHTYDILGLGLVTISRHGAIPYSADFTLPVEVSGITATLLGKAQDRKGIRIDQRGGVLAVIVGFSWDVPAGFDLSSGDPLP